MAKPKNVSELLDSYTSTYRIHLVGFMNACYPLMKPQEEESSRVKLRKEFEVIVANLQSEVIELESKLKRKQEEKI